MPISAPLGNRFGNFSLMKLEYGLNEFENKIINKLAVCYKLSTTTKVFYRCINILYKHANYIGHSLELVLKHVLIA